MEKHFWLDRWQQQQIGFHQSDINAHLKKHWAALFPEQENRTVLVPLCGKSLDMLWLSRQGHAVIGVELSELAVKDFFAENSLPCAEEKRGDFNAFLAENLTVLHGDFFDLRQQDVVAASCVYDRAALVALPSEMRSDYANHLAKLLMPGSCVLLVTMDYPQQQMSGPPFSVDAQQVKQLFEQDFDIELLDSLDVLAGNPRLAERGLSRMWEHVWKLTRC